LNRASATTGGGASATTTGGAPNKRTSGPAGAVPGPIEAACAGTGVGWATNRLPQNTVLAATTAQTTKLNKRAVIRRL
jgi:hypothetical protein